MRTVPAGTFLVPMLLSALLYTVWPDLLQIGGVTEAFLGGGSMNVIIGLVTFCSGIGIELKSIGQLIKRHGVLLVVKLLLTTGLGLGYVALFGQEGISGISALAFIVTISSVNAALYVSLVNDYGTKVDSAAPKCRHDFRARIQNHYKSPFDFFRMGFYLINLIFYVFL